MAQRADDFIILRRKPIPGYDISFLITYHHTEIMNKQKLIDFLIHFMQVCGFLVFVILSAKFNRIA